MRLSRKRSRTQTPEISMLNLIDVIFVLLIFFMVVTTFNTYNQFGISLPESAINQKDNKEQKIEVILNKDKEYFLKIDENVKKINAENLSAELSQLQNESKQNIRVTADKNLEYGIIIDLMSKLKNSGIKNINLNMQTGA